MVITPANPQEFYSSYISGAASLMDRLSLSFLGCPPLVKSVGFFR